ncbi:class-II fumarase/aspartase family protein [Amycolatopsis pithecellobii]|uniref:Adenylosuccinate lyase family protein n=1 Tax=Amycolatopsis pithecellobii TaxID=664692 RepID=A0A6N7YP13_9PSEU|nr:adenylosuccinate lyase family protein [Amycolatopsis pithecellobii]MTD54747.1 adenylosuccinate lyase family protein [Amycolatopsis pithecellobii]
MEFDAPAACRHERSHITDSIFHGHSYATAASKRIFCDVCRYQRWLDVEAALAMTQGELGILPAKAAKDIEASARVELLDLDAVREDALRSGHSLIGLLRALRRVTPDDSGEYLHYGATTQDIQDTAQSLEIRDVLDELDQLLRSIVTSLVRLAERHGDALSLGRTHAQPALPMGFGVKLAGWIDEILRHAERVATMRPRVLTVQMFGAVGTMAGFGEHGPAVLSGCAARLGLGVPASSWHTARDRVAEYVSTLAMIAATLARIADEIRLLSRPEFAEVEEAWQHGEIGSSTMPHKRNPERCEQVVALARLCAGLVAPALMAMTGDGERDARALRVEWACVADAAHYCLAAATLTAGVLDGLRVDTHRLAANVRRAGDQLATERLMLALARKLGRQTAYERVYDLVQRAHADGRSVRAQLADDPTLAGLLDPVELDHVFDPMSHLGRSPQLTRRAVEAATSWLQKTSPW